MNENAKTPPPKPGIYYDVPFDTYLSWDAFHKSMVKDISRSPAHLEWAQAHPLDTTALRLGSLTDLMLFEPDQLLEHYAIRPDTYVNDKGETRKFNANSTVCKAMLAQLEASGKPVIDRDDYEQAMAMRKRIYGHREARAMLSGGRAQVSLVWWDDGFGCACKGRVDYLRNGDCLVDLKTSKNGHPSQDGFGRECMTFGYHIQAAMYTDGWAALTGEELPFVFLVVEKTPPYAVSTPMFERDGDSILVGRKAYKRAGFLWKACKNTNLWPGYSDFREPIEIPLWARRAELGEEVTDDAGF